MSLSHERVESMSSGPVDFPEPIEIVIPAGTGDADAIAFLLATIGRPPASADDQGWRQTISACRRANLEDRATSAVNRPEGAPTGLLIRPDGLLLVWWTPR